jgi:glycosyltransferase involved in cell wall biosynthesis
VLQEKPEIQFLMVGDGAEKESLVKSARDRGISNIHFHAPVCKDKVKQFYALADVCLVPLRNIPLFETFIPSKMFEMMAMGCPIIGSLKGEAAEILDRSNGGVSIPPESSDALSRTILRLVAHRDETRRMGQSGREFVVQNYSRGRLARRYAAILCEVLG